MVFFELFICVLMNISVADFELGESVILWLSSCIIMFLIFMTFSGLLYLYFRRGPYIAKTYQKKSLCKSYWGKRQLADRIDEFYEKEFAEWLEKDTEETRLFLIREEKR